MKKLILITCAAALALLTGCHTAHIEVKGDGSWTADIYDHWMSREIKGFEAEVAEGGKFKAKLTGMKSDASEQLPAFTREMWAGLGFLGRIAASMYNPAAATVQQPGTAVAAPAATCTDGTCAHGETCASGTCEIK